MDLTAFREAVDHLIGVSNCDLKSWTAEMNGEVQDGQVLNDAINQSVALVVSNIPKEAKQRKRFWIEAVSHHVHLDMPQLSLAGCCAE